MKIKNRRTGYYHEMALDIKKTLEERGECGIGGMMDGEDMLNRLKDLGINAIAEPTYRTMHPIMKYDEEGEPINILFNERVQTGTVFIMQSNSHG